MVVPLTIAFVAGFCWLFYLIAEWGFTETSKLLTSSGEIFLPIIVAAIFCLIT